MMFQKVYHNVPNNYFTYHINTLKILGVMNNDLPESWYKILKHYEDVTPSFKLYDVCHRGKKLFNPEEEESDAECDVCSEEEDAKCRRHIFTHYDMRSRLINLFSNSIWSTLIRYPFHRRRMYHSDGKLRDILDSTLFKERCRQVNFKEGDLMVSLSSDSVGISKNKGEPYSITPILLKVINLPVWLRSKVEYQWLLALIPGPKPFKNPEIYLDVLIPDLIELSRGIVIPFDACTREENVRRRVFVLHTVNDLRAVPKLNQQKQTPSTYGACNICCTVGMKVDKYPVYPGSISFIPTGAPLRLRYKREMPAEWRHLANANPPALQTDASIRRQHENLEAKKAMYKLRDPFLDLPFFRTQRHHLNDPSHLLANMIELIWSHLLNVGKYKYKTIHHDLEVRFRTIDPKYPPWSFNAHDLKMVTHYITNCSYFDKRIPNPVTHISALKFTHWFALSSHLGIFIIEQSTLSKPYKELFMDLTNLIRLALLRSVTVDQIREAEVRIHMLLAQMEVLLPFRVNSMVKHHFHHLFTTIEYVGPVIGYWM